MPQLANIRACLCASLVLLTRAFPPGMIQFSRNWPVRADVHNHVFLQPLVRDLAFPPDTYRL